ncbi:MAG TPA: energy transducer TonB, partial [Acidobacteriota bacterium]|nr:energy transducer TonB [Acidobacteriota bacterium]
MGQSVCIGANSFFTPIEPVREVQPVYPAEALRDGIEGEVLVEYDVRTDGKVGEVRVMGEGNALLQEAVAAAMRAREYKPYTLQRYEHGPVHFRLCFEFRLPKGSGEQPSVKRTTLPEDRWRETIAKAVYPYEMLKKKKSGKAEVCFL